MEADDAVETCEGPQFVVEVRFAGLYIVTELPAEARGVVVVEGGEERVAEGLLGGGEERKKRKITSEGRIGGVLLIGIGDAVETESTAKHSVRVVGGTGLGKKNLCLGISRVVETVCDEAVEMGPTVVGLSTKWDGSDKEQKGKDETFHSARYITI